MKRKGAVENPEVIMQNIRDWFEKVYYPSECTIAKKNSDQELSNQEVLDWIENIVIPVYSSFNMKPFIDKRKDELADVYEVTNLADRILLEILIPNGFVYLNITGQKQTGVIIKEKTKYMKTFAGRNIPVYTIRWDLDASDMFLKAYGGEEYVLLSDRIDIELKEAFSDYRKNWKQYFKHRANTPLSKEDLLSNIEAWMFSATLGRSNYQKAYSIHRQTTLAEEFSHSDTFAFISALTGQNTSPRNPEDYMRLQYAEKILKPDSSLMQDLLQTSNRSIKSYSIVELEGKMNALAHSVCPVFSLIDLLNSVVFKKGEVDIYYKETNRMALSFLSEKIMDRRTVDSIVWKSHLLNQLPNYEKFSTQLKKTAKEIYCELKGSRLRLTFVLRCDVIRNKLCRDH